MFHRHSCSTLFPYTTLFRSLRRNSSFNEKSTMPSRHFASSHASCFLQPQCTRFLILLFIANVVSYPWYPIVSGASLNRPGLLQSRFLPPSAARKGERGSGAQPPGPQSKGLPPFAIPLSGRHVLTHKNM